MKPTQTLFRSAFYQHLTSFGLKPAGEEFLKLEQRIKTLYQKIHNQNFDLDTISR